MKYIKTILFFLLTISVSLMGQVGINTTSPQSTLQVVGKATVINSLDGIIAPSITGDQLKLKTYTMQQNGALQYVTQAATIANRTGQTINVDSSGYYYFSVIDNVWYILQNTRQNWVFDNSYEAIAENPVDVIIGPISIVNDVNLGLSLNIAIPAFSTVKVVVHYSVPIGLTNPLANVGGYMGIRFLKNGDERDSGSRKVSISSKNAPSGAIIMTTIGATYVETITNNGPETTVSYTLNGYIEKNVGTNNDTFRYNMWSSTGDNFNWGKGTINAQVFVKPL
jgi:hypothetical protein